MKGATRAPPRPAMTQVKAALWMAELRKALAAASKAGHTPPKVDLAPDGMSRRDAQALANFALRLPGVGEAFANAGHPAHREIAGLRSLVDHFLFVHPIHPDGRPKSWAETGGPSLSPAMAKAIIEGGPIDRTQIRPREAAEIAAYGTDRYDIGETGGEVGRQVAAEIDHWKVRAAEPAPPEPMATETANGGTRPMDDRAQAQARWNELNTALLGKMSAPNRRIIGEELAELAEMFPGLAPLQLSPQERAAARDKFHDVLPDDVFSPQTIALTEKLRGDKRLGAPDRQAAVRELAERLEKGPGATVAPAPGQKFEPLSLEQQRTETKGMSPSQKAAYYEAKLGPAIIDSAAGTGAA